MANITRSLADTAGFIPQAWANKALDVLRHDIAMTMAIARDTDFTDPGWKGKSITVPYPGTFSAQDKTAGNVATVQTPSNGSSVSLSLTQHKTVDFILEDVAFSEAQSGINMMNAYGEAAGVAIAEQVETDLLGLFTSMNGGLVGTAGTDMTKTTFFQARQVLNQVLAPKVGRSFVFSNKDATALFTDSTMQNYFAFNGGAQADWQEGKIGRFAGFDLYESNFIGQTASGHRVQTVTISGGVTGGTFTLTYSGQTTAAIAWNASASAVQTALNALSSLGAGYVTVDGAGGNNGVYTVFFTSSVATPAAMTGSAGSLTGGTPALTIADAVANYQNLAFHKNAGMIAFRPLINIATPGVEVAYANDPMSGVSIRVLMQYRPDYRGLYVAYDVLYGFTALRPNQGVVVLS